MRLRKTVGLSIIIGNPLYNFKPVSRSGVHKRMATRGRPKGVERRPTAIVYIRMSTGYQVQTDSNSAEMQRSVCMRVCEQNELQVSKVIEQVKSGKLYRKDLFDVITNEMRAGDSIVVYSITRFARKQLHAHLLIELLQKKKCRLISASENIDTSKDDSAVGLFAWLAEIESRQISSRVKSSIEAKKERLEHVGGMPYGYKYSAGKGSPLEVNREEMDLVIRMRKMRKDDNLSFLKIARALNVERIPSPKKQIIGGWTEMTVKRLVERDESKVLTKGKRSWYLSQQDQSEPQKTASSSFGIDEVDLYETDPESDGSEPERPDSDAPPPLVSVAAAEHLSTKPVVVLKAMILKREEFGFTADDLKDLGKDDLIEILS